MTLETPVAAEPAPSSYRRILTATSLLGGATAINLLISMARSKVVAIVLGPVGMGLMGVYLSIMGLALSLASCGLNYSGVRELAAAVGSGDVEMARRTLLSFRQLSWFLALSGTFVLAALAWPISLASFGDVGKAPAIVALSLTVAAGLGTSYFTTKIQAAGEVGRVAAMNVASALIGAAAAILCLVVWREAGVVPALLAGAGVQYAVSWWYARRLSLPEPVAETRGSSEIRGRLLQLGGLVMIIGLMASAVMFAVRSVVMQQLGPEAVGYFQSAFGLSGMYAGYILGAMGTDFLPRLSAVSSDHDTVNQLVNEQTEVALLLGLPGVLGTILFAPLIIPFFYSAEFAAAVPVLQLMSVGVFGRLVSWPMSFVVIAKNEMRLSLIAESLSNAVHLAVVVVSLRWIGVAGTGWASILSYVVFTVALYVSLSKLTQFKWTPGVRRVLVGGLLVITATIGSEWTLVGPWKWGVSISIWCVTSLLCLRSLIVAARVTQPGIVRRLKSWFGKGPADASS